MRYLTLLFILFAFILADSQGVITRRGGGVGGGGTPLFIDWNRVCEITIVSDSVDATLTNFPVLLTEDNFPSEMLDADGSYPCLGSGGDIRFSTGIYSGDTLAHEVVGDTVVLDNDPANSNIEVWVKIPSLTSGADVTIYVWYDSSSAVAWTEDATYGRFAVWDDYELVYHFYEAPTDTTRDATVNQYDATFIHTTPPTHTTAKIDSGYNFAGSDARFAVASPTNIYADGDTLEVSIWSKRDALGGGTVYHCFLSVVDAVDYDSGWWFLWNLDNYIQFSIGAATEHNYISTSTFESTTDWYHLYTRYNEDSVVVYVDTNAEIEEANAGSGATENDVLAVGAFQTSHDYLGDIDELQISRVGRSKYWPLTVYRNQDTPATFALEGTPETP